MRTLRSDLLRITPTRALSRLAGAFARIPVPRALRPVLWTRMARILGIDLEEIGAPLETYRDFVSFFTRALRPGARPVDADPEALVSPVDGCVAAAGPLHACQALPVKGTRFTAAELLLDHAAGGEYQEGNQITLYLSPADYHRIHAPMSGAVERWRHLPGRLLPVNPPTLAAVERVFPRNERVVSEWVDALLGRSLCMVLVGALNVGSIRLLWDAELATNRGKEPCEPRRSPIPRRFRAGEEAARFELGSTVVLLGRAGAWKDLDLEPGTRVRQGQRLARWAIP